MTGRGDRALQAVSLWGQEVAQRVSVWVVGTGQGGGSRQRHGGHMGWDTFPWASPQGPS